MKLHDSSIAQIARLVQVAIITGTDIVDQLRSLRLVQEGDDLKVDPEYQETFDKNLQELADSLQKEQTSTASDEQLPLF